MKYPILSLNGPPFPAKNQPEEVWPRGLAAEDISPKP